MSNQQLLAEGPVPLYFQLTTKLKLRVLSGEFDGTLLPSEDALCNEYSVSKITVRRALADLTAAGLIMRRRGIGTFVADRTPAQSSLLLRGSLKHSLYHVGSLERRVLAYRASLKAPDVVRDLLLLAPGARVSRIITVGASAEGPVIHGTVYVPEDIASKVPDIDVDGASTIAHRIEEGLGQPVARAEQIVEPGVAGASVSKVLGIAAGTAILQITHVVYLADGRPVEVAISVYHPGRFKLQIALSDNVL